MLAKLGLVVMATGLFLSGSLGDPFLADEVGFSSVERSHFGALAVTTQRAPHASEAPLLLRVHIVGDASSADIGEASRWLLANANIQLVRDPKGAPLYLTYDDLAATSGRSTLGATLPTGMAIEMRDPRIAPCVLAHEVLHFVGLKHVDEAANIMYPHCARDQLQNSHLDESQLASLAKVRGITALTTSGAQQWAVRLQGTH